MMGLLCDPIFGECVPEDSIMCGGADEPCCLPADGSPGTCDAGLSCQMEGPIGFCYDGRTCGAEGAMCCDTTPACDPGTACVMGACTACGRAGNPCCTTGAACGPGLTCGSDGQCGA